jgi:hypothetical protein
LLLQATVNEVPLSLVIASVLVRVYRVSYGYE